MGQLDNLKLTGIRQKLAAEKISDLKSCIARKFKESDIKKRIKPDDKIAVTAGSRGISNINLIIKEVIKNLQELSCKPFIVPGMGSHGGATAAGQEKVLAAYGITEEKMGVPIKSSLETVNLGKTAGGVPVYFSKIALAADGIISLNRIKLHTDFHSDLVESGMAKMLVIGLGKHRGAEAIHSQGVRGLKEVLPRAAELIIEQAPVIQGIGLLENGYEEINRVEFVPPENLIEQESELLDKAEELMPSLPVEEIDVAVVQEMGKNISGTGMDTNIIGRMYITGEQEYETPRIKKLVVCDLTSASHGNAMGIGLADITTKKLLQKIDIEDSYENIKTSSFFRRGKIPLVMSDEKEALQLALNNCWVEEGTIPRVVVLKNTLELENLYVSEPVLEDLDSADIEVLTTEEVYFTEDNNFRPRIR